MEKQNCDEKRHRNRLWRDPAFYDKFVSTRNISKPAEIDLGSKERPLLTVWQDIFIITVSIVSSLAFWWIVRQVWPPERRRLHNEITGWQISVLGTTYAVIMGFMMFAVWSDFRTADGNVSAESSCLINLYWAASGLPAAQRDEIRALASQYANAMIDIEWPDMAHGVLSTVGTDIIEKLWQVSSQTQSLTASQQVSLEAVTTEIGSITEHRRIRQLESQITLPAVLWEVLIVGAIITVMSSCLFGSEYPALHMLQVVTLSLLLSMVLVAISDVNRPFRGFVHVKSTGFENAKNTFDKHSQMHGAQ